MIVIRTLKGICINLSNSMYAFPKGLYFFNYYRSEKIGEKLIGKPTAKRLNVDSHGLQPVEK